MLNFHNNLIYLPQNTNIMVKLLAILFLTVSLTCSASQIDTLRNDTLMSTPAFTACFKGGTVVKKNSMGEVVEGVLAVDTDLWTTGPLVFFASGFKIKINEWGKVYTGVSVANFIAQACNNNFYEFKGKTPIAFDPQGLVIEGFLAQSIEFVTIDGIHFWTMPGTDVRFYSSGKIMRVTLSDTEKLSINKNEKIAFMAHHQVTFNHEGYVSQGVTAKKATFVDRYGNTVTKQQGDVVRFDQDGLLIE